MKTVLLVFIIIGIGLLGITLEQVSNSIDYNTKEVKRIADTLEITSESVKKYYSLEDLN